MNIPLQFRKCLVLRDLEESEYPGTDEINSLPTPAQINDCLIKWLATSCSTLMSGKDVDVDGVRRCFRTATANKATTVHLTGDTWVWRDTVEWYWQAKTEDLRENHIPVTRCPPQIPHRLTWARTRGSAVSTVPGNNRDSFLRFRFRSFWSPHSLLFNVDRGLLPRG
jgi:hypothetical protein